MPKYCLDIGQGMTTWVIRKVDDEVDTGIDALAGDREFDALFGDAYDESSAETQAKLGTAFRYLKRKASRS